MNSFTIYSKTTGEIIRYGTSNTEIQVHVKMPDESVVEGIFYPHSHYFENDLPVEYTLEEAALKSISFEQRIGKVWSNTTRTWVETRSIAEITAMQWSAVRAQRDFLLRDSDWTQLPDAPTTSKSAWTTYRQALRDITAQTDPTAIVWPVSP